MNTGKYSIDKTLPTKRNILELYLNDVYERKCMYKVSDDEVGFIQTGIENLVQEVAGHVLRDKSALDKLKMCLKEPKPSLDESTFFAFQNTVKLVSIFAEKPPMEGIKVTTCVPNIIKVGSFYEQTKNNFPDEFDFILLYACVEGNFYKCIRYLNCFFEIPEALDNISGQISHAANYSEFNRVDGARKLSLDPSNIYRKGPATCLPFIYKNGSCSERTIYVDIVPAIKVMDSSLAENVSDFCDLAPFHEEILSIGSYVLLFKESDSLFVYGEDFCCTEININLSIAETEVHFIRTILSEKHRKAYRILKFLINGHNDDDSLAGRLPIRAKHYSSYKIKTVVIFHHFECINPDSTEIGSCILQVLEEMCKHENMETFPSICYNLRDRSKLCLKQCLEDLAEDLWSMKTLEEDYDFMKYRSKKSVTQKFIDDNDIKSVSIIDLGKCLQNIGQMVQK